MNVHLAIYTLRSPSWNGHAQMMHFLVEGLCAAGHTVTATHRAPDGSAPRYVFSTYDPSIGWRERAHLTTPASPDANLWNDALVDWAATLLRDHETDVVYAQGGGDILDIVQAGATNGHRLVYHVHDFDLICDRRFLLDHACRPCSGPESVSKCWHCIRRRYSWTAQTVAAVVRIPGVLEVAPGSLRPKLQRYAYHEQLARQLSRARATVASVDCFIATGAPVARVLRSFGVPEAKVSLLPHVVTRPELAEAPPTAVRRPGPVRIGYFGRLAPEKGVDMLARVLASIRAEGTFPFHWHIICDGHEDAVRELVRSSHLADTDVTHVQTKNASAIAEALRTIDIAVFPSPGPEIGPLALLECLRQGVVCVASDSLGMAAVITEGVSGYLFPSTDEEQMRRAVCRATAHPTVQGHAPRRPFLPAPDHHGYFRTLTHILAGESPAHAGLAGGSHHGR